LGSSQQFELTGRTKNKYLNEIVKILSRIFIFFLEKWVDKIEKNDPLAKFYQGLANWLLRK
jgi:hypothetical protein